MPLIIMLIKGHNLHYLLSTKIYRFVQLDPVTVKI